MLRTGRQPDILHCHDWSTADVAKSYWTEYHHYGLWKPKVVSLRWGTVKARAWEGAPRRSGHTGWSWKAWGLLGNASRRAGSAVQFTPRDLPPHDSPQPNTPAHAFALGPIKKTSRCSPSTTWTSARSSWARPPTSAKSSPPCRPLTPGR